MSTNSTTTPETTRTRTDLPTDVAGEADTDESTDRQAGWTARCQRQFGPHGRDRLENLVDRRNLAMPDPEGGSNGTGESEPGSQ